MQQITNEQLVVKTDQTYYFGIKHDSWLTFWLQDSMHRVYPRSKPNGGASLSLLTARNARLSFQACVHNQHIKPVHVECEVEGDSRLQIQVRRVGYVPQAYLTAHRPLSELEGVDHAPGLVPDPLFPEAKAKVTSSVNQSFWISVKVPADIDPGNYKLKVQFKSSVLTEPAVMYATVEVKDVVIEERQNFPITHWWYPECFYDYYEMKPLGDEFFKIVRPYLENLYDHGNDLLFVPLLNYRREIMKRPPQLLKVWEVSPGVYKFDWELVRKLIRMAKEIGFHQFEWSHFWAYSHAKERAASAAEPTRIYTERDGKLETLFPDGLDATGEVFRNYMMQFLPEFKQFLEDEGIKEQSLFHICDEPTDQPADIENYKKAREFLKEIDPSVKVMDAVKGISYSELGLTDYPVPIMYRANEFLEKEIPHWVYYCCSPAGTYMNRFFDTPLWQIRIQGWAFYRLRVMGFLHWGYNYWYTQKASSLEQEYSPDTQIMADLFHDCSCGGVYPFGDPFVVYPGKDGPIDSIRWEVFAESMQDYALLQTLEVHPDDDLLSSIVNYDTFPSEDGWVAKSLASLLGKELGR